MNKKKQPRNLLWRLVYVTPLFLLIFSVFSVTVIASFGLTVILLGLGAFVRAHCKPYSRHFL